MHNIYYLNVMPSSLDLKQGISYLEREGQGEGGERDRDKVRERKRDRQRQRQRQRQRERERELIIKITGKAVLPN